MSDAKVLLEGLEFPESPRWHGGRIWVADWGAQQIVAADLEGSSEVIDHVASFPFSIDWLPDGDLQVVSAAESCLLRKGAGGSLTRGTDLSGLSDRPWNELVVDGRGNSYVDNIGFEFPGGDFAPGLIALVTPDGSARVVADDLAFPNGMAITPDNATRIVGESYANRLTQFDIAGDGSLSNRRVWADVPDDHPDGICVDAEGAVRYADVGNRRCARVAHGGAALQTIDFDRGCFACMLGGRMAGRCFASPTNSKGPQVHRGERPQARWLPSRHRRQPPDGLRLSVEPKPGSGRPGPRTWRSGSLRRSACHAGLQPTVMGCRPTRLAVQDGRVHVGRGLRPIDPRLRHDEGEERWHRMRSRAWLSMTSRSCRWGERAPRWRCGCQAWE